MDIYEKAKQATPDNYERIVEELKEEARKEAEGQAIGGGYSYAIESGTFEGALRHLIHCIALDNKYETHSE